MNVRIVEYQFNPKPKPQTPSGADFLIYGPVKQARNVIPTCAMNDAIIAHYAERQLGTRLLTSEHPLNKTFKKLLYVKRHMRSMK